MPFSKFKDFCERSRSELFVVYAGGCPRRAGLPARCGSSLQRNDAGVWLCEYPGLSFQRSPVCACSLVSSLLLSGATMSQQSSLTQSAHSVRQVLTAYSSLRSTIGRAAELTVKSDKLGKPAFQPHQLAGKVSPHAATVRRTTYPWSG